MAKQLLKPRKIPSQKRAQEMNRAILDSTARILKEGGLLKLNTNAIAERAGISVGSLYQYYPNKESILASLLRQDIKDKFAVIEKSFLKMMNRPRHEIVLKDVIQEMIILGVELNTMNPELNILAHEKSTELMRSQEMLEFEQYLVEVIAAQADYFSEELRAQDIRLSLRLIFEAVKSASHLMTLDRSFMKQKSNITSELVLMAQRYLLG